MLVKAVKQALSVLPPSLADVNQTKAFVVKTIDALLLAEIDGLRLFRSAPMPFEMAAMLGPSPINRFSLPEQAVIFD
jgi:hypothetical protein